MWQSDRQVLDGGRVIKHKLRQDGDGVAYGEVLRRWRDDPAFRDFFTSLLSASEFSAYRWETPPVTKSTVDRGFEFVLINAPGLSEAADVNPFSEHFQSVIDGRQVVKFSSLGKDAVLIAPCPIAPLNVYGHLGTFLRGAPPSQVHELWQTVGSAATSALGAEPVWVSTAGMGVSWLHVRLDSRPKYYHFAAYRKAV
jgi:hypothetical protein